MRYADWDIVFQEVPDEVTLALNISGCPHRCEGCHSPHLREEVGEVLTEEVLDGLLNRYPSVTCVGLMGGDGDLEGVCRMARYIRKRGRKVAWYTGMQALPQGWDIGLFDYIKVGPYVQALGGLRSPHTNQRFYRIADGRMYDETWRFQR